MGANRVQKRIHRHKTFCLFLTTYREFPRPTSRGGVVGRVSGYGSASFTPGLTLVGGFLHLNSSWLQGTSLVVIVIPWNEEINCLVRIENDASDRRGRRGRKKIEVKKLFREKSPYPSTRQTPARSLRHTQPWWSPTVRVLCYPNLAVPPLKRYVLKGRIRREHATVVQLFPFLGLMGPPKPSDVVTVARSSIKGVEGGTVVESPVQTGPTERHIPTVHRTSPFLSARLPPG